MIDDKDTLPMRTVRMPWSLRVALVALLAAGSLTDAKAQQPLSTMRLDKIERMLPRMQRDGEDIGAEQGAGPLEFRLQRVGEVMQAAQRALASEDFSGRASSAQQAAIEELDVMLTRLQRQCQECAGGDQTQRIAQKSSPKPGQKPGTKPGEAAAATASLPTAQPVDRQAVARLIRDVWGKLPQRQRDEILQPLAEEFLPEYAAEIEAYFEALAADRENATATETPR